METLSFVLSPIIAVMDFVFEIYIGLVHSVGAAILLLSATFSLVLRPFHSYGKAIEQNVSTKIEAVSQDVAQIDPKLKGEARFNAIERIYEHHGYHPISSVLLGINFLISIPVLLAAIFVITQSDAVSGQPFGFIADLSQPDQLVSLANWPINVLPVMMLVLTVIDAKIRYTTATVARHRFYIIAIALFFLVYLLPAGLILYWITANLIAFGFYLAGQ